MLPDLTFIFVIEDAFLAIPYKKTIIMQKALFILLYPIKNIILWPIAS